jgi:predicted permease
MTNKKDVISYKKILTNPILISFIVGIFIFLLRIPEIDIATQTMSLISGINTPLAMIISGVYLAQADLKLMFSSKDLYLISPIATLLFLMILPKDLYTAKLAILIAASAPTGSNVAIYAQQYEKDYSSAVLIVCITTILSIITLPIITSIAATLF